MRTANPARGAKYVLPVLAAFAAIVSAGAASACSGRLSGAASVDATYEPFQALDGSKEFPVTVQNTGETECIFWLGVERLAAGSETATLNFALQGRGGVWSSTGAGGPGAVWLASRRLAPNESYDFPATLAIPAGQILPPGDWIYSFDTKLAAAPDSRPADSAEQLHARTVRLSIAIPAHLSINIAGAGMHKTIDFGELIEGDQKQVRIETRSNQRYQLNVGSRNGGFLAMAPPYSALRVPYTMVLNGKAREATGDDRPIRRDGARRQPVRCRIYGRRRARQAGRTLSRRGDDRDLVLQSRAEFPKVAFPVLGKNSAKTKESKQAFVGQPRNVCFRLIML